MSLLAQVGVAPPAETKRAATYGRPPVTGSADLNRIIALPRRDLATEYTPDLIAGLEAELRLPPSKVRCICAKQQRPCPTSLKPIQAYALVEAARAGGLVGPIGAGHGKTLIDLLLPMVMPGCKMAVLLIPANLRTQLLERDWDYYGGHWRLPNLVNGRWFKENRPAVDVITYTKLQQMTATSLLKTIKPDLIICDEAHNLKSAKGPRVSRFRSYLTEFPKTRLCVMSGTMATKSIHDYAHLAEFAFGDNSPLPHHPPTLEEWANAIDPCSCQAAKDPELKCECRAHPGALVRLCRDGEHVREGFRRRRNDTLGVVATNESAIGTSLVIRKREPGKVSNQILAFIDLAHSGERPDGEQFTEQLQASACARQLACGFFHRWRYPRGEPAELIDEWFKKRKAFNKEVYERLKHPRENLDSPGLLVRAAIRWYSGYVYTDETTKQTVQVPPKTKGGPRAVWPSVHWPEWSEIHDKVRPVPEAVWLDDFVVKDAAAWAKKDVGIVWVDFPELGERIAKAAGVPFFGGGPAASDEILREKGDCSIVASIKAHGTGKNLQPFCRNLVVTPPADGGTWEQMIARTHRPGQQADEVEVEVMLHTADYEGSFAKAREIARFLHATEGPQKLVIGNYAWAV